jgi:hypothetical protein
MRHAVPVAIFAVVLLMVTRAAADGKFGFTAYCNYPCVKPHCDPAQFDMAPCSETKTGGIRNAFPRLGAKGQVVVNNGVPQRGNLTLHLQLVSDDIDRWLPDKHFAGHAVIDFEAWTPIWEENTHPDTWHGKRYQTYSLQLVREAHPGIANDTAKVAAMAKKEFEAAAVRFFVATLDLLRERRPKALLGFYGFPQGDFGTCLKNILGPRPSECGYDNPLIGPLLRDWNDGLAAVWNASTALFPSVYLSSPVPLLPNATWRAMQRQYLSGLVNESLRLSGKFTANLNGKAGGVPVLPFAWALYHDMKSAVVPEDVWMMIEASWQPPLSTGIIQWGLTWPLQEKAMQNVDGPILRAAHVAAAKCSTQECSGHGWCRHIPHGVQVSGGGCVCGEKWSGDKCEARV